MCVSQVFKLLTDLKEQRKDSGKNKHSAGQQNLNTIMYEVCSPPHPSIHWLTMWCKKSGLSDIQFYDSLHLHTDAEVPVEDTLHQTKPRDCKRIPHHNDAS